MNLRRREFGTTGLWSILTNAPPPPKRKIEISQSDRRASATRAPVEAAKDVKSSWGDVESLLHHVQPLLLLLQEDGCLGKCTVIMIMMIMTIMHKPSRNCKRLDSHLQR